MNKNRMILAATGGVVALAVLGMAGLVWNAHSAKVAALEGDIDEGVDGLENVVEKAQQLSRGRVYPGADSVKAVKANIEALSTWRKEALVFASRGDRPIEKTTPPALKAFLVQDAKRIASLHGAVNGMLVGPKFVFGPFKDYIAEGKMPPEAKLPEIQRRWDDVATLAEVLSESGIDELVNVEFRDVAAEEGAPKDEQRGPRKRPARGRKPAAEENAFKPSAFGYMVTFRARPNALVKSLNALVTSERFVVVDTLAFDRARDILAEALGGEDKKKAEAAQQGGRRRRRRGGDEPTEAQTSAEESAAKNGIVTDPMLDEPLVVTLGVTVYDFGSLADDAAAKEEKGASK